MIGFAGADNSALALNLTVRTPRYGQDWQDSQREAGVKLFGKTLQFGGDRRGATAVEFALVAPVALFMVVAVVEYSLFYFKTSFLKHVLYEASRNVQTGEVQDSGDPQGYFQTEYCDDATFLIRCEDVFFDVRAAASLSAITFPEATFNTDGEPTNFVFQPGGANDITTMRVATPYRFITPFMQDIFQPGGGPAIIVGYSVARNEPF